MFISFQESLAIGLLDLMGIRMCWIWYKGSIKPGLRIDFFEQKQ